MPSIFFLWPCLRVPAVSRTSWVSLQQGFYFHWSSLGTHSKGTEWKRKSNFTPEGRGLYGPLWTLLRLSLSRKSAQDLDQSPFPLHLAETTASSPLQFLIAPWAPSQSWTLPPRLLLGHCTRTYQKWQWDQCVAELCWLLGILVLSVWPLQSWISTHKINLSLSLLLQDNREDREWSQNTVSVPVTVLCSQWDSHFSSREQSLPFLSVYP